MRGLHSAQYCINIQVNAFRPPCVCAIIANAKDKDNDMEDNKSKALAAALSQI